MLDTAMKGGFRYGDGDGALRGRRGAVGGKERSRGRRGAWDLKELIRELTLDPTRTYQPISPLYDGQDAPTHVSGMS
jgi:hypothetical protein